MNGHVLDILSAYLDNELSEIRRQKVEAHLDECILCRSEYEGLQRISSLLRSAPAPEFTPADLFAARVALQLPREAAAVKPTKRASLLWWLAPVVLLGAWFFVQTALTLSSLVSALDSADLLGSAAQWLSDGTAHSLWFSALTDLFGGMIGGAQQSALSTVDQLIAYGAETFSRFLWQAVIALLYLSWLAAWWIRSGARQARMGGQRS